MKVIQTVPSIDIESSGPSYSVVGLCRGLASCGVEAELHVPGNVPISDATFKIRGYHRSSILNLRGLEWSSALSAGLKQACKRADIIHSNSLWMIPNIYPYKAVEGARCKLVTAPRGTLSPCSLNRSKLKKKIFWVLAQKAALGRTDMFHATSEKEYDEIRNAGYRQPVAVVPIGMDIPQVENNNLKMLDRPFRRVAFFGRLHPIKAVSNLVKAWGMIPNDNWELVIAGPDCGAKPDLESIVRSQNLPRVRFVGEITGVDKYTFLSQADIYVLPSLTENFGITLAEALACGTPCIASQGTPWGGLEKEKAGRWIPIGVEPLAATLKEIMSMSDDERRLMGERGRVWIERDFSWRGIGEKMKQSYEWLLGRSDRPEWVVRD